MSAQFSNAVEQCPHCGAAIEPGSRFCNRCGGALTAAPSPAQPASGESIVGIIPNVGIKKGLFKADAYNLVLTPQRLVFARLTSEMLKEASSEAKEQAKEQGKGFFGQWGAMISSNSSIVDRYLQMPVEAILAENPDSFSIPLAEIKKAKTKSNYDPESDQPDELIIEAREKYKIRLKTTNAKQTKNALKPLLGDRIK